MNKYEIRTQKKKTAIVAAALELFGEKGFVNVSIKKIAALANVSQVSIYNYFTNKEALIKECTNIMMEELLQNAKDLLIQNIDYKEKLFSALSLCSNNINHSLYEYFSSEALEDKVLLNLLTESINEQKNKIYRDYIELGKQEGVIDNSISTSTILDLIEAINIIGSKIAPVEIMKSRESEIQKLFLYGILGHEEHCQTPFLDKKFK